MRKDIVYGTDLEQVQEILNLASQNDIEFFEIVGNLNDEYLIENEYKISLGTNVKPRKYIIIKSIHLNEWSSGLSVIQTDDDELACEMYERYEIQQEEYEEVYN